MANRTTVKSDIQVINVPSVSNADLNTILQTKICDNVVFKEDVAVSQSSSVTAITCDFTGKDRINLTRTGGALQITVSGIADGDRVFLLITKTAGQAVTFVGVTDITPVVANITAASVVLFEVIRKSAYYFASAVIKSPLYATDTVEGTMRIGTVVENNALTSTTVVTTPGRIPKGSVSQVGIYKAASATQVDSGSDSGGINQPLVVQPSQLKRKIDELADATWLTLALSTGWQGTVQYFKDALGNIHLRANNLLRTSGFSGDDTNSETFGALPSGYLPEIETHFVINSKATNTRRLHVLKIGSNFVAITPDPDDYTANATIRFEVIFRAL
jgi:hypothetical protein